MEHEEVKLEKKTEIVLKVSLLYILATFILMITFIFKDTSTWLMWLNIGYYAGVITYSMIRWINKMIKNKITK